MGYETTAMPKKKERWALRIRTSCIAATVAAILFRIYPPLLGLVAACAGYGMLE
jgi:hypothetical protein